MIARLPLLSGCDPGWGRANVGQPTERAAARADEPGRRMFGIASLRHRIVTPRFTAERQDELMQSLARFRRGSALAIATLVPCTLLTGCASVSSSPTDPPTPSMSTAAPIPTSSPTSSSDIAKGSRIIIDGTGISFASEKGLILDSVAYTADPFTARDRLTEWLGSVPRTTSVVSEHYCAPATRDPIITDVWGPGLSLTHLPPNGWERYRFAVTATSASVGDIALSTPHGFSVGESPDDLIAGTPGVETDLGSGVTRVYYDQPDPGWTAYAWAWEGGPIHEILAPYALEEWC